MSNIGTAASGKVLQGGGTGASPTFSTATYPSTATGTGKILRADGTNWAASTATYPDTAGTNGNVLTSDGTNWTSAAASGGVILTATKLLTSTQIKSLHGTPIQFIAAPGSGKMIVLISVTSKFTYGGSNVFIGATGQNVALTWGTTPTATSAVANSVLTGTTTTGVGTSYPSPGNVVFTSYDNAAMNLYNPVATEITGNAANDNTISIIALYYIFTP